MKDLSPQDIIGIRRWLCKNDLFYLLRYELSTKYAKDYAEGLPLLEHDFLFDRCREVQTNPDGFLDLWARYHFKTTIITYGLSIQTVLNNPECTICILSQNNKEATKKLLQIKNEFQTNHDFIELFNDLFLHDYRKYTQWSEEKGLVINRRGNSREPTFSAFGLVDSQPTGSHFTHLVYDDVVVPQSVVSDISLRNTEEAWELSLNLSLYGGVKRYAGTRYHFSDCYTTIMEREAAIPRIYPCFKVIDGVMTTEPALYPKDYLEVERRGMGPYTWAAQMLLSPTAEGQQGFKIEWAQCYIRKPEEERKGRITYLICDPASMDDRDSDYTAMVVLGLGADRKIRLLDAIYDRINLTRRWEKLRDLHSQWKPLYTVYERVGKDVEVEYIREKQMLEGYVFNITEVGGNSKKETRINRLIPPFENGDILLPSRLQYRMEWDGREINIIRTLQEEMRGYPLTKHDHLLDAISRLYDPAVPLHFPKGDYDPATGELKKKIKDPYLPEFMEINDFGATWLSA